MFSAPYPYLPSMNIPLDPCMVYIYLHLVDYYGFHVGKICNRPMDAMGKAG